MTDSVDELGTGIRGAEGVWPSAPDYWSFSSLKSAQECPRRWSLSRASYPGLWDRSGYPPKPSHAALFGNVVHRALEVIMTSLCEHGCASVRDASAVVALRELGGYSALIYRVVDEQMAHLESNPRASHRIGDLRSTLLGRAPEIRQRVQEVLARMPLRPPPAGESGSTNPGRLALREGAHTEATLRSPELHFLGRVDLLTITAAGCEIVDYKTGQPDQHHAEQLRLYALLWCRDREKNPGRLPVTGLTLSYPTSNESVPVPDSLQMAESEEALRLTIQKVEQELQHRPARARASEVTCTYCDVRHLCAEYWRLPGGSRQHAGDHTFSDAEGSIVAQNGSRSWLLRRHPGAPSLLLRSHSEHPGFVVGDRVRLLDVMLSDDPDSGDTVLCLTRTSEIFQLEEPL